MRILLLLTGLIVLGALMPPSARAEVVTLVADEWCPYNCDPASDRPGFMIEIARAAFAPHGIDVAYIAMPWSRAIEDTRSGRYDGIIGAYYSDAPDFIYPAVPQGRITNVFYVAKDSLWNFRTPDDLQSVSLGVVAGYSYSKALDEYIQRHQHDPQRVQVLPGDGAADMNIKKLLRGRIGSFIEDRHVIDYKLAAPERQQEKDSMREAGILPMPDDGEGIVFIAFSPAGPDSARYAAILATETENLRRSGALKAILDRYAVKDFGK